MLHQIRYCSNEVYTFDTETKTFKFCELYLDLKTKKPFNIFNNACSCIVNN